MKMTWTLLLLLPLALSAAPLPIIPAPREITAGEGTFTLPAQVRFYAGSECPPFGRSVEQAARARGGDIVWCDFNQPAHIRGVAADPGTLAADAYELSIATNGITIRAGSAAAGHHAVQSLYWLVDACTSTPAVLPCVEIRDAPRYGWRGFMLDESRHFFGPAVVRSLLDQMSRLKLNVFHWHLTDEPAWRIEILKYPKLTEVGGTGSWSDASKPAAFYTQQEIREIVAYAAERHITIVPEIDMPGHANAATRAYPEFGAPGPGRWNGFTFHPAREATYQFLEDVLTEVAGLFPGPWIHVGGDEVHYGNMSWTSDVEIVAFTKQQGLKNAVELEHYFMRRVAGIVQGKLGRQLVGWDEIAGSGLKPAGTVPMWWRHDKPKVLDQVLAGGFPVVLAPRHPCYFDFVQDDAHKVGRRWDGFNDLARVYAFPQNLEAQLAAAAPGQVLGLNACLWTERVADPHRLGFMTFPRLSALAESAWTVTERKDLEDFRARVPLLLKLLDRAGLSYFNPADPAAAPEPDGPSKADIIANG